MKNGDIEQFIKQVVEGNVVGVRNNIIPEFVEIIIDEKEGYKPIHVASRHGYLDIAKLLIDFQCDIDSNSNGEFKPIHLACKEGHLEIANLLIEHNCNIESETEEEYRPIHLACQNGHYDIAKLLIDHHCHIECETYEKHRPIHLVCINGHLDIAQLLIEHQCNIESESFNKQKPIHLSCVNGHLGIVKLLIENQCEIESTASIMKYRSIHLACVNGHLDISQFLIDSQCNIESESFNKYRPIHLACEIGNLDIVKLLISHQCNIDSETINKYRPIHLASMKGHLDIVKFLVQSKCQTNCETQNGCLPQDLAERAGHTSIMDFLNAVDSTKEIIDCIKRNTNMKIEKLKYYFSIDHPDDQDSDLSIPKTPVQDSADGIMKYVFEGKVDEPEISELIDTIDGVQNKEIDQLLHECLFFRCITDHHQAGFQLLSSASIINGRRDIVSPSFLELVAERGCYSFIDVVLKKSIYDKETWDRAKKRSLEKGHQKIFEAISNRESLLTSRQDADISILHTAVCDNDPDMVRYIVENDLVDSNWNNQIFGTALALAHLLCHTQCISVLEQLGLNPNSQNQYLQTPLHEAIVNGMDEHCAYLIDRSSDIDTAGFMGFTALHTAVMRGCEDVCLQLVKKGADCGRYIQLPQEFILEKTDSSRLKTGMSLSTEENALTLCMKLHGTIYPCFLDILDADKSNSCDGTGNPLLHMAIKCLQPHICKYLLKANANIERVNKQGNTCMLELLCNSHPETCPDKIIDIVNILIEFDADINKTTIAGTTVFQLAAKFVNERLMLALVTKRRNQLMNITEDDFKLAFIHRWFNYAEVLLEFLPADFVSANITNELVHLVLSDAGSKLINSLFDSSTSDVKQLIIEDILYHASKTGDDTLFESLLNTEICSPKLFENGETLLTNLLIEKKITFCLNLFQSKSNKHFINLKNRKHQIPLQIAIDIGAMDMVDHLIFESEQLDNEDENGITALTSLFHKICNNSDATIELKLLSTIKSIISRGGNIYKMTSRDQQVIDSCSNVGVRSDIELFHKNEREKLDKSTVERVVSVENVVIEKVVEVEKICNVCIEKVVNCVIECGHTFCMDCGNGFEQCPFCKFSPTNPKRIFFN